MSTPFGIRIEREGKTLFLRVEECTKDELIDFVRSLPHERLQDFTCVVLGYLVGSAVRIDALETDLQHRTEERDQAWVERRGLE